MAKLYEAGIRNVVATFGAHVSSEQIELLDLISEMTGGDRFLFFYDRDQAGMAGTEKALAGFSGDARRVKEAGYPPWVEGVRDDLSAEAFNWNQTWVGATTHRGRDSRRDYRSCGVLSGAASMVAGTGIDLSFFWCVNFARCSMKEKGGVFERRRSMSDVEALPVPRYEVSIIGGWAIVLAIDASGTAHQLKDFPDWHAAEQYCRGSGYGKLVRIPGGFSVVRAS